MHISNILLLRSDENDSKRRKFRAEAHFGGMRVTAKTKKSNPQNFALKWRTQLFSNRGRFFVWPLPISFCHRSRDDDIISLLRGNVFLKTKIGLFPAPFSSFQSVQLTGNENTRWPGIELENTMWLPSQLTETCCFNRKKYSNINRYTSGHLDS